jgi:uncharacterized protein (DUF608 family)
MERLTSQQMPVDVIIQSWSPTVPGDYEASSLPVAYFDVYVHNKSSAVASLDLALFMPNFLNWRPDRVTSTRSSEATAQAGNAANPMQPAWTDWSNDGNYSEALTAKPGGMLATGLLFRESGRTEPVRDMQGEVLLGVTNGPGVRANRALCFRVVATNGRHTAREAVQSFFENGRFPEADEFAWRANHNEVLGSAVAGGVIVEPGAEAHFTIIMVWDLPLVEFGSGRTWEKEYTARYGTDGRAAQRIAADALAHHDGWQQAIESWHRRWIGDGPAPEQRRHGAIINDLYYIVAGGTTWVAKQHAAAGLEPPLLGPGEHFALLEGYDRGYHFYNTFDLWPYAMSAFEANWPRLADRVFADYLRVAPMTLDDNHFIAVTGASAMRKAANKIPHDVGSPPGDPWNVINEYNAERDSNVWKDHNPEFILSFYVHCKRNARPLTDSEWATVLKVARFMLAQDTDGDGLPDHNQQGDNTWDALSFTGPSPFSGGLTIGALAALTRWSEERGDATNHKLFSARFVTARDSYMRYFWNGHYYRAATNGDQQDWILSDALFGILLADAGGLKDLLPKDQIVAHLQTVAQRNWRQFASGQVGPALMAPPSGPFPSGVQLGEVLVGSAWPCAALMRRVGLNGEAYGMVDALSTTLYETSGMQFRTPAAWTPEHTFRAPSNLRPLASWYWLWPDLD